MSSGLRGEISLDNAQRQWRPETSRRPPPSEAATANARGVPPILSPRRQTFASGPWQAFLPTPRERPPSVQGSRKRPFRSPPNSPVWAAIGRQRIRRRPRGAERAARSTRQNQPCNFWTKRALGGTMRLELFENRTLPPARRETRRSRVIFSNPLENNKPRRKKTAIHRSWMTVGGARAAFAAPAAALCVHFFGASSLSAAAAFWNTVAKASSSAGGRSETAA
jgi:hypothetical protein